MKKVKKPYKKDYTKPFIFDDSLVTFDSKKYIKDVSKYVLYLEQKIKQLENESNN